MRKNTKTLAKVIGSLFIVLSVLTALVNLGFWNPGVLYITWLWNPLLLAAATWRVNDLLAIVWSAILIFVGAIFIIESD